MSAAALGGLLRQRLTCSSFIMSLMANSIRNSSSRVSFSTATLPTKLVGTHSEYGISYERFLKIDLGLGTRTWAGCISAVDAIDNGINQYDVDLPSRYVNNTSLSSRVRRLNLDWLDPDQSPERENEAFQRAMMLAGGEFMESIHFHAKTWLPARLIVMECLAARKDIDSTGEIMLLTRNCPWKLHIFKLEKEMKIDPYIKYVIYQDDRSDNWRVQAVAVSPDKFQSRKPLLSQWRGLTNEELSEVAGIPGCVFVHMSSFIGGNQSYEGALAMAKASLIA